MSDAPQLCFKKCNIASTVKCYEAACRIQVFSPRLLLKPFSGSKIAAQIENGRFQQAAKMYKEVAEIAEGDGIADEALKNFKLAAEYYAQVIAVGCFTIDAAAVVVC